MINLDSITNENNKEHNEKWPYIPDHPYRILIIGGSGSGKTNALINLINEQHDIDKIITKSYFSVPQDVRLTSTHYLIMKINNRRKLQNIAINNSADIDYKDLMKIYQECTKGPSNCLTIDTMLPASDRLRFRKNLFDSL